MQEVLCWKFQAILKRQQLKLVSSGEEDKKHGHYFTEPIILFTQLFSWHNLII